LPVFGTQNRITKESQEEKETRVSKWKKEKIVIKLPADERKKKMKRMVTF
jgi:hypothetical protein